MYNYHVVGIQRLWNNYVWCNQVETEAWYLFVSLNGLGSTQTNADAWSTLQSPNAAQSLHSSIAGVWYATCCMPHHGTAWHSTFAGWNRTSSWTFLSTWLPQSTCLLCLGLCTVKRYKVWWWLSVYTALQRLMGNLRSHGHGTYLDSLFAKREIVCSVKRYHVRKGRRYWRFVYTDKMAEWGNKLWHILHIMDL